MTKLVSLSDKAIAALEAMRQQGESYSQVILRLVEVASMNTGKWVTEAFSTFKRHVYGLPLPEDYMLLVEYLRVFTLKLLSMPLEKQVELVNRVTGSLKEVIGEL